MIFPIVRLLTHAAWIYFFETSFLSTLVFTHSITRNLIFVTTSDLYSRGAAHTQWNW